MSQKKSDVIRFCVKIPGRVQNIDKAIELLGGEEALIDVSQYLLFQTLSLCIDDNTSQ